MVVGTSPNDKRFWIVKLRIAGCIAWLDRPNYSALLLPELIEGVAYAGTSTGTTSGFLNLHSPFGHCATGPAFSHFSIK